MAVRDDCMKHRDKPAMFDTNGVRKTKLDPVDDSEIMNRKVLI